LTLMAAGQTEEAQAERRLAQAKKRYLVDIYGNRAHVYV